MDIGRANLGFEINIEDGDNSIVISSTKRLTVDADNARILCKLRSRDVLRVLACRKFYLREGPFTAYN